jgi:hypothetical protein
MLQGSKRRYLFLFRRYADRVILGQIYCDCLERNII